MPRRRFLLIALLALSAAPATAVETLTFRRAPRPGGDPVTLTATGRVVLDDSAGNRYFETDAGARYLIAAEDVLSEASDDRPFEPVDADTLGERLLAELPPGFRVHTTKHYAIAYDTSREYAEWVSSLLEGLHKALVRYWKKRGLRLEEPEFPLPVVIHRSQAAYNAAAAAEGVGEGAIGYYHLATNTVRMYDLTGSEAIRANGRSARRGSRAEITRLLSTPVAEPLVATVVHEATHQVCFNTGVMQRLADLPLWLVEGMAVYFEAPKAGAARGWRGIGQVNARRLATFRRHRGEWNASTLRSLIASDDRLRDPRTAGAAYADAWALNYYLIQKRPKDYVAYVTEMAGREPFERSADGGETDAARRRLAKFEEHFGPLPKLQETMLRVMDRL